MYKKRGVINETRSAQRVVIHSPDYVLMGLGGVLCAVGIMVLFSASEFYAQERFHDIYFFIRRQIILGIFPGMAMGILFYFLPFRLFRKFSVIFFFFTLFLSAAVFIPVVGVTVKGASRWLAAGPIQFQPSEFLKIGYIFYLSALLASGSTRLKSNVLKSGSLISFLAVSGLVVLLLAFQPDIGTLGLILVVGAVVYFVSRASLLRIFAILLVLIILAGVFIFTTSYRVDRLSAFLNPGSDPLGIGYQVNQALIAIGSGGVSGSGLGMSQQKFGFIPQPIGDSIFVIFAEEFGFIGGITLIVTFMMFAWRGLMIARHAPDLFTELIVVGVTSWIAFQAFINIGAMMGLIPLTGITLPFFSYGGSAMAAILSGMGIILNVSKHTV